MKKQYIAPNTVAINVQTQGHMLFGSGDGNTINGGGNKGNYSGNQLSRESNWTDED